MILPALITITATLFYVFAFPPLIQWYFQIKHPDHADYLIIGFLTFIGTGTLSSLTFAICYQFVTG